METENTCFICQRFDGAVYDKRYKDIIEPVVRECGLAPYRVDEDPSVDQIFEDIMLHIKAADIIVAEISTDNPNVWLEVGLAIAFDKPIVFLCDNQRKDFPFDIRHRKILVYKTDSLSDYNKAKKELKNQITAKLARWSMASENSRPTAKEMIFLKAVAIQKDSSIILTDDEKAILNSSTAEDKAKVIKSLVKKNCIQYDLNDKTGNYYLALTDKAKKMKAFKEGSKKK